MGITYTEDDHCPSCCPALNPWGMCSTKHARTDGDCLLFGVSLYYWDWYLRCEECYKWLNLTRDYAKNDLPKRS
jgi:hypothetical protein